jgi:hypothetical protein
MTHHKDMTTGVRSGIGLIEMLALTTALDSYVITLQELSK